MKIIKKLITLFTFTIVLNQAFSQSIQLSPYSGYTFSNKISIDGGTAKISGGHTFGGILTVALPINYNFEILYSRHINEVTASSTMLVEDFRSDAAYNYILAGFNRIIHIPNTGLKFYGGPKFGATILSSIDDKFSTRTNFAVALDAGMVLMVNNFIGLRVGANVKAPIVNSGVNLWWGTGSGPQVGVSSWSPIAQFNLLGGIVINIGL
jgi:hypothetical protein